MWFILVHGGVRGFFWVLWGCFGKCLENVWKMFSRFYGLFTRFLENIWKMFGKCLQLSNSFSSIVIEFNTQYTQVMGKAVIILEKVVYYQKQQSWVAELYTNRFGAGFTNELGLTEDQAKDLIENFKLKLNDNSMEGTSEYS